MKITDRIKKQRIYFDGGLGTMLQKTCLAPGQSPETLNISNPHEVTKVHRAYLEAGCDVISTNTFGAVSLKFDNFEEIIKSGINCVKEAMKGYENKYIALSLGPTGRMLKPLGDLDFEDAVTGYAESIKIAAECGVDLILFETMTDCYETKAAVLAAKENCDLPVFVTNAYDMSGKLMTGAEPKAMIAMLEGLGVDAIGMNCSFGPDKMEGLLADFIEYSSLPIIVNPNAGLPEIADGKTVYSIDESTFADIMVRIAARGAAGLGGCCGTTPGYIKEMIEKTRDIEYRYPEKKNHTLVSSYTHSVEIGNAPVLIGERINPTGKKAFKEALRENNINYILEEAVRQEEKGVHILDVNVGLPEIDEKEMMLRAVSAIQAVSDVPLQIDSSSPEVLEKALRIYNGKALVNSVDASGEKMSRIFPLVKKYGAAVIALTLDENGIPETAEKRLEAIQKIVKTAQSYGIDKKDIIADPLALTVSSDDKSALVTLDSIRIIKEKTGIKTSLGVSNISFGLPQRDKINSAFFAMALENGLDCAIMNPFSQRMMDVYFSFKALKGLDKSCLEYIAYAAEHEEVTAPQKNEGDLKYAIVKGLRENAVLQTGSLLDTMDPLDVINSMIIPALNEVGDAFENKKLFLPQLLASADAASASFDILKTKLPKKSGGEQRRVIVATVKGDIHDIGKNIVKALLESFGFAVTDLGRDVDPRIVFKEVADSGCRLVGLSALMTTTVPSMKDTIELLKKNYPDVKTVVGGAVLTKEYAEMINADFYASDAMETVRYAQRYYEGE